MNNSYVKRPDDTLAVEFDFTEFAARVDPEPIEYLLKAEAGLTIAAAVTSANVIGLVITGGSIGRVYRFGFEAKTQEGDSQVDMRVLRIREPLDLSNVDDVTLIDPDEISEILTTLLGEVLTTEDGETLYAG